MIYLLIFSVAVLRVFARAAQQLNVVNFQWMRVPVFSYLMAAGDFGLWGSAYVLFGRHDWLGFALAVVVYGTAGWFGAILAMKIHQFTTRDPMD